MAKGWQIPILLLMWKTKSRDRLSFLSEIDCSVRNCPLQKVAISQPMRTVPGTYAFEREWQGQSFCFEYFYMDPITVDILPDYQTGQVLLSTTAGLRLTIF